MVKGIPQAWLEALPEPLVCAATSFTLVKQGRAQTCFLTLNSGDALFAKQVNGCSLQTEVAALQFLSQVEPQLSFLVPKIHSVKDKLLITYKLQGETLQSQLPKLVSSGQMATALAEFHQLELPKIDGISAEFSMPNAANFTQALSTFGCDDELMKALLDNLASQLQVIAEVPEYMGLSHGDLTTDNWLLTADTQLILLDWELASIRDVRWDLAAVCEEFSLSNEQVNQLVNDYLSQYSQCDAQFEVGLVAWRYIYLVVCFIWAVEEQQDSQSYYAKLQSFINS